MGAKRFKVKRIGRESGLVREFIVTVDEEDAHLLRSYYWKVTHTDKKTYVVRTTTRGDEPLHSVIANVKPGERVFHINGDSLDNRRSNLMKQSERVEEISD